MQVTKTSIQVPLPRFEQSDKFLRYPCYAEAKYDGEYNVFMDGKLINKYGKVRSECRLTEILSVQNISGVLLGELVYREGHKGELFDLLANKTSEELSFVIFDLWEPNSTQEARRKKLASLELSGTPLSISHSILCQTEADLQCAYDDYIRQGYEGMVVKNKYGTMRTPWYKVKEKMTHDLRVVQVEPNRIEVEDIDGRTVGVKCTQPVSAGDIVEIEHQGVTKYKSLRHPVFIRKRIDKQVPDRMEVTG